MVPALARIQKTEEWHTARMQGIGGSDWQHILSAKYPREYKYGCVRKLYYEKIGIEADTPEKITGAMARGSILEPIVAELFEAHSGCTYVSQSPRATELFPGQPVPEWWLGTPDFICRMPDGSLQGLECKTMNRNVWYDFIDNGLKISYKIQAHFYIGLTGLDVFHLAILWADGLDFATEPVPRSDEMLRLMYEAGSWFWDEILPEETPPERPPVSEERCASCPHSQKCLGQAYFHEHETDLVDLSGDKVLYNLLQTIEGLKAEKKDVADSLDEMKQDVRNHIIENHGDDTEDMMCREFRVKWVKSMGSRFEKNKLLAENPNLADLLNKYTKHFPRRTLSPKITKKSAARWETMKAEAS